MQLNRLDNGSHGFTLVELTLVLVLIGILSALGIGLFASSGAYSASAARDQFVASTNLATKLALARSGDSDTIELRIEESDTQWRFIVDPGNRVRTAEREKATLTRPVSTLSYTPQGRLDAGAPLEFAFTGNSAHRACVLTSGFAYAGACP